MISGAFAIVSRSLSLGCFPSVKVVDTSAKYEGQLYIPEVNYMLMTACVAVTLAFNTTENISHAYGIAVVSVMVITTCMVGLVMMVIWSMDVEPLVYLHFLSSVHLRGGYIFVIRALQVHPRRLFSVSLILLPHVYDGYMALCSQAEIHVRTQQQSALKIPDGPSRKS